MDDRMRAILALVGVVMLCTVVGFLFGYFGSTVSVVGGMMYGAGVGTVLDALFVGITYFVNFVFENAP